MKTRAQLIRTILIIALTCFFQLVKAQIVYTDVNPDLIASSFVGCTGLGPLIDFNIDINDDGSDDFEIHASSFSSCNMLFPLKTASASLVSLNGNELVGMPLDSNVTLDANQNWLVSGSGLGCYSNNQSLTCTWGTMKYIGVRLIIGSDMYYGWIRASISTTIGAGTNGSANGSLTLFNFAYNAAPGQSILTGQTCPPQAVISPAGPVSFCHGDSAVLSSVSSGSNLSYQWKQNGINIIGATDESYIAKEAGTYKVKVTDNTNACSSTSAKVKVKVPCKVLNEEISDEENFSLLVYPNPLSSSATISFSLSQAARVSLQIFDAQGRLIRTLVNEKMSAGTHTLTWNARDENGNGVSEGIYFVRMKTESEVKTIAISEAR